MVGKEKMVRLIELNKIYTLEFDIEDKKRLIILHDTLDIMIHIIEITKHFVNGDLPVEDVQKVIKAAENNNIKFESEFVKEIIEAML